MTEATGLANDRTATSASLKGSFEPLSEVYDVAMLDLDGVVYVGGEAVPGAPDHISAAREAGVQVAFITNNASRPPEAVVAHLDELGITSAASDVVTSAQAAAGVLATELAPGSRVALLGGDGLAEALSAAGLKPVEVGEEAQAIVSGYGPEVRWREVMRAAVLIREGLWWVASNTDSTIPTPYGVAPGHGLLVETLQRFSGVDPVVAGKPSPPLLRETISRMEAERPLMVGDRLDTDIAGGAAVDVDTLLVLTGVTGLAELAAARPDERPTYLSEGLEGLRLTHPSVESDNEGVVRLGGWEADVVDGACRVRGTGDSGDWWRCVAVASWAYLDRTGDVPVVDALSPPTTILST